MKNCLIPLIFLSFTVKAQVPFNDKYKDCATVDPCLYCGDTPARYKSDLVERIQRNLDRGASRWMSTSGRMFFEILVDSTGHSCVLSIKDETHVADVKDNIRRCINNLWDWAPAQLNHRAVNSTVILESYFIGGAARVGLVKLEELK